MLIEEARDVSGLSYPKLDQALGLPDGQAFRYSQYPIVAKTRAPQAGSIQQLEVRVASFLKRPAHGVVVENNSLLDGATPHRLDLVVGTPSGELDLGDSESTDLQLGYEGDWPTYRRLKHAEWCGDLEPISSLVNRKASYEEWPEFLALYSWQWGVLWDQGIPWLSRPDYGFPPATPVSVVIRSVFEAAKQERARLRARTQALMNELRSAGNLTDYVSEVQILQMISGDEIS
ncbi:hypothetical protein [Burkholderia gladioli]|uniref:hypothetical protein n=1 Tax=Burkholderia gladioli TaxID=28095 RepID=UPI003D370050